MGHDRVRRGAHPRRGLRPAHLARVLPRGASPRVALHRGHRRGLGRAQRRHDRQLRQGPDALDHRPRRRHGVRPDPPGPGPPRHRGPRDPHRGVGRAAAEPAPFVHEPRAGRGVRRARAGHRLRLVPRPDPRPPHGHPPRGHGHPRPALHGPLHRALLGRGAPDDQGVRARGRRRAQRERQHRDGVGGTGLRPVFGQSRHPQSTSRDRQ